MAKHVSLLSLLKQPKKQPQKLIFFCLIQHDDKKNGSLDEYFPGLPEYFRMVFHVHGATIWDETQRKLDHINFSRSLLFNYLVASINCVGQRDRFVRFWSLSHTLLKLSKQKIIPTKCQHVHIVCCVHVCPQVYFFSLLSGDREINCTWKQNIEASHIQ